MTKDQALQIVFNGEHYYVNSYIKKEGTFKLIQIYGPFSKKQADRFKTMTKYQRKKFKKRLLIDSIKNMPCKDCGEFKSLDKMTFDHIKGEKQFDIANGCRKSWQRLLTEIEKCELVCRCCHNVREYLRGVFHQLVDVEDLAELLFRINY